MLRFVPPLVLMGLIFFFSAQPDLNSGLGVWDTIGRKIIHAATYGTLWFLWWRATGYRNPLAAAVITLALRGERRVAPDVHGGPPRHPRRRRHRRDRRADRLRPRYARKSRSTETTSRWSSSCGSPETVTVPTTPTPRTITGNAPPWAAYSRSSRRNCSLNRPSEDTPM